MGNWTQKYVTAAERNGVKSSGFRFGQRPNAVNGVVGKHVVFGQLPNARQAATEVVTLCQYTVNESNPVSREVAVDVFTPSSRLTCSLQVFVEASDRITSEPAIPGAIPCVANIFALAINPTTGNPVRLNNITTFNPPRAIQIDPGYRAVRLVAEVSKDNWDFPVGGFNGAYLRLSVAWEPNVFMEQEELQRLYASCRTSSVEAVIL